MLTNLAPCGAHASVLSGQTCRLTLSAGLPAFRRPQREVCRRAEASGPAEQLGLLVPPTTPAGQQAAYLLSSDLSHLFDDAFDSHLRAVGEGQPVPSISSRGGEGSSSEGDIGLEALLHQQIRRLRELEVARAVHELLYLRVVHRLQRVGWELVTRLPDLERDLDWEQGRLPEQSLSGAHMGAIMSPAAADCVQGLVAATVQIAPPEPQAAASEQRLVAQIERVQAAQLYFRGLEHGYTVAGLEARACSEGVQLAHDPDGMVEYAAQLPPEDIGLLSKISSSQAWQAAARHTGALFDLPSSSTQDGGEPLDGLGPYPQLLTGSGDVVIAPRSTLAEHYNLDGREGGSVSSKDSDPSSAGETDGDRDEDWGRGKASALPAPDLVTLRVDTLKGLLEEAALLGYLLWEAEAAATAAGAPLVRQGSGQA